MEIPKEKRELIEELLDEHKLEELESTISELSKEAADLESKESDEVEETEEETKEEIVYVTKEEVIEAVGAVVGELQEQITTLTEEVGNLNMVIKELKEAEEERVAQTPAASMTDMIKMRAVGNEEARVDGRRSEAKDGPKLPPGFAVDGPTPSSMLNELMAASPGGS